MPSPHTPTPPIAVSAKEAARLLSISLSKLYELMRNDDVQSYVDGCSRRVTMSSIHGYVERRLAESGNGWRQITPQPRSRQQASELQE
jgi:excisionase family DNA binding protein